LKDWAFEAPFSRLIQHEGNGHTMVARIYKPAKTAMQSGTAKTHYWVLEHEPSSAREIDPLMGWTSSGDMNTQVTLRFETRDEAVAYAEKHKIPYQVFDEQLRAARPKSYSDNFRSDRVDGNWTH
jgi:hypothetical protein